MSKQWIIVLALAGLFLLFVIPYDDEDTNEHTQCSASFA